MLICQKAMALFDAPPLNQPKSWKDLSLDFRLMFVYHGSMMVLFMSGGLLSVRQQLLATAPLVVILVSLSLRYRRSMNWRWPGARPKDVLSAVGILVLAVTFDFAAIPLFPLSDPRFLPWHLAGIGIAAFGVLCALKVIQVSNADFLKECEPAGAIDFPSESTAETIPVAPIDPIWKRATRAGYSLSFFLVGIAFMTSFYLFGVAFRDGSPRPTPTQTEPLNNHGQIVYIPQSQKNLIDSLQTVASIGIPSVLALGLILHFLLGVKLYPNAPTLEEWRKRGLNR
jgi:hypothetical protein